MAKSRIVKLLLLIISVFLYFIYGNNFIFLLVSSIMTYYLGKVIAKNKNIYLVIITYLLLLLPFIFFKYLIGFMKINILVPLGISYYTLSLISYISDMYHDKYECASNIFDFLLFSFFFPCLFIGPINRYNDFKLELEHIGFYKENVFNSLLRIGFGLIKKMVIANKLNVIIISLTKDLSLNGLYVLIGCFIYSVLLYCDFSGGIDIVLGISKLFNLELKENFDRPYLSENIKEFWRRWHITLGSWLKDYIYIPLGGNRGTKLLTTINVLVTFLISGLWHGIHYLLWGLINGILVIVNFKTKNKYANIFLTIIIISFLWIFFIYNDTITSLTMFASIFTKFNLSINILSLGLNIVDYGIIILAFLIVILYENKKFKFNNISIYSKVSILLFILLIVLLFGNYGLDVNSNNFIYGSF